MHSGQYIHIATFYLAANASARNAMNIINKIRVDNKYNRTSHEFNLFRAWNVIIWMSNIIMKFTNRNANLGTSLLQHLQKAAYNN